MNAKVKWSIRSLALLMILTLIGGLAAAATGFSPAPVSAVTLGGEPVRYSDAIKPPEPKPMVTEPRPELPRVESMTELLRLLNSMGMMQKQRAFLSNEGAVLYGVEENAIDDAAAPVAPTAALSVDFSAAETEADGGYSITNSQVSGVEEGDIVKTDGRYLYVGQNTQVSIVRANGADMEALSVILLDGETGGLSEMYVSGDRLVLVYSRYVSDENTPDADGAKRSMIWRPGKQFVCYAVYDVSDRGAPVLSRLFEVEGTSLSTRMSGDILYFAANKYLYSFVFDEMTEEDILPTVLDTAVSPDCRLLPAEDIQYFPNPQEANYLLTGAFDITVDEPCEVQTFLGAGQYFYMNRASMYVVRPDWQNGQNTSALYRFSLEGTDIFFEASGAVSGQPLNQYSMDEYDGYFRIATTDWGQGNYVTVFDSALKETGRTPALAPDESIQSVRFMGDTGYVVTFRQTDPLFVLDLSDPKSPVVLGELKIPGFSQYLHPVGDGLLVGFGRHTLETFVRHDDGTEEAVGTRDAGMKISLFDVSDPKNPVELDKLLMGDGSWSDAFENPRAMMVDANRGLFGFPIQVYGGSSLKGDLRSGGAWEGGLVVCVENKRLVTLAELKAPTDGGNYYGYQRRLCYIGDTLYMTDPSGVTAYNYNTFAQTGSIRLSLPDETPTGITPYFE